MKSNFFFIFTNQRFWNFKRSIFQLDFQLFLKRFHITIISKRIQIFKAKSDIISFSKTLGQETSSQLQAQKCSKSDNCQNTIFKTTSAKKKISRQWSPKRHFQRSARKFSEPLAPKATRTKNHFQRGKRLEPKIIFTAIRAKKIFAAIST